MPDDELKDELGEDEEPDLSAAPLIDEDEEIDPLSSDTSDGVAIPLSHAKKADSDLIDDDDLLDDEDDDGVDLGELEEEEY